MKYILTQALYGLCLVWFLGSCQSNNRHQHNQSSDSAKVNASQPLFDKVSLKYAQNFKVDYYDGYKVVTVTKAFTDQTDNLQYVLVPHQQPAPKGFKPHQIVRVPVRSMVTLSTTHVALADALGLTDFITGNANNAWISLPSMQKRIKAGKVVELGGSRNFNQELLVSLQPDIVLMSSTHTAGYQKKQAVMGKSTRLIVNSGWMEQHPLARAEWLKFLAVFYNKEKLAAEKFDAIEAQYLQVKKLAAQAQKKPSVFCGLPFKGTWYTAKGGSYMAQFLRDAQSAYFWNNTSGSGSHPFDFETVFAKAHNGDFWLNVSAAKSLKEIHNKDARFTKFAAFNQKRIYNNNKRINAGGGNDYWVTGFVNPHLVLRDLVKIFHPELLPEHELVYYQQLK
ncbi:ABC transporter substrate-binding protein [uncultured Microscilla sp.]|uniref:ABC transporter substrate-binding protein n=1 Tax=uncultured Microscilla sp. TaxID=432653 RepID=UPI00262375D5|nr:ABC transporter substrate-binding protein [uncultured Microscilla sp.]